MTNDAILVSFDEVEEDEESFDFNSPEDVLIEVVGPYDDNPENLNWKNWSIESCTIIRSKKGVIGAASYEKEYGGFLDYTIKGMTDCPGEGWFVVVGITGYYHRGDGWETDDDMEFYYEDFRPATADEIALA